MIEIQTQLIILLDAVKVPFLIFICGEVVAQFIFVPMHRGFVKALPDFSQIARGCLERAALFIGLINGFTHIIIAFGALKLGTRFVPQEPPVVQNNYFLIGNFTSLILAMSYAALEQQIG